MKGAVPFRSPESAAVTLQLPHRGTDQRHGNPAGDYRDRGRRISWKVYPSQSGGAGRLQPYFRRRKRICHHGRDGVQTQGRGRPVHSPGRYFSFYQQSSKPSGYGSFCHGERQREHLPGREYRGGACLRQPGSPDRRGYLRHEFMVRDDRMARLVEDRKEPITPFIRFIRSLYTILECLRSWWRAVQERISSVADTVLQMDCYEAREVTKKAKELAEKVTEGKAERKRWVKKPISPRRIEKARVHGWDTVSFDKTEVDLRYLEQIVDETQTAALAYLIPWAFGKRRRRKADGGGACASGGGENPKRRTPFHDPQELRRRGAGGCAGPGDPGLSPAIPDDLKIGIDFLKKG